MKKRKIRYDRLALVVGLGVASISAPVTICYKLFHKEPEIVPPTFEPLPLINISLEKEPVMSFEEFVALKEAEIVTNEPEFIGTYKLTGYCACSRCCGDYADGITATGTVATEGRTIAVDPNKIPLGSKVMIEGLNGIFYAEDIGSAINNNRIDIYKDSHSACFSEDCNGYADVYLLKE